MERITDAWDGLGRRERILAIVAVAVLVLVIAAFLLLGGTEEPPVDATTSATVDAAALAKGDVPAMVVSDGGATRAPAESASEGRGVAGLTVSGGGGDADAASGVEDNPSVREANRLHVEESYSEGAYVKPVVSDAVKAAGRDLERVAAEYTACIRKAKQENADSRHCLDALDYGVFVETNPHTRGGMTFTKMSSDGHQLDYTVMQAQGGSDCRALDGGSSCDAWTSS